jgi:glycosyl hydrolase family 113
LSRITRTGLAATLLLAALAAVPVAASAATPPAARFPDPGGTNKAGPPIPQKPLLGVDLYAVKNYPAAVVSRDGLRDLSYIQSTLGAQSVGLVWDFYSPGDRSNVVKTTTATLSVANLQTLTEQAQADHLSIQYRPLVVVQKGSQWEGYLSPANQAAWFASYYSAELPYLKLAQKMHVREFVVQTELRDLNASKQWPAFLAKVKKVYSGIVSYAALGAQYYPRSRHLLPVRYYGMTAYPDLNLPDTATVARLVTAWKKVFAPVPAKLLKTTAIDETGIPALSGAYHDPSKWTAKGKLDETVQARFFSSLCIAAKDLGLRAVYFWNANLTDDPEHPPYPSPTTFEGKTGATAIAGCAALFS